MPRRLSDIQSPRPVASREEWEAFAAWLRRQLRVSLCLTPEPRRAPLNARVFDPYPANGYVCEKVALETLPGFWCTGNLFRPTEPKAPFPVILCPHGHWSEGRIHDHDKRGNIIGRCIQLAQMGAYVFSYDMVGYVDSCQLSHRDGPEDYAWGLSTMALQTWNSIRALDFMLGLPGADPERVGVTGASGGGTQSFMLAAVDDRVTATAPICMVSYEMQGGCICENAPLLRLHATNVDIAALPAPTPQFIASCTGDWTKHTPENELPFLKRIYGLYGAGDRVSGHHIDFEHSFNQELREHAYGFFNQVFWGGADRSPIAEPVMGRPPVRERLVWYGRQSPPPFDTGVFRGLWRARVQRALLPLLRDPARLRNELVPLLPHVLALDPAGRPGGDAGACGSLTLAHDGEVLRVQGALPAFTPPKDVAHYLTYNPSPLVAQVWEILHALAAQPATRLVGNAGAGPAVLLAAAVAPGVTDVEADLEGFDDSDAAWSRLFDTPALRQIGGLATVRAALESRTVNLLNSGLPA